MKNEVYPSDSIRQLLGATLSADIITPEFAREEPLYAIQQLANNIVEVYGQRTIPMDRDNLRNQFASSNKRNILLDCRFFHFLLLAKLEGVFCPDGEKEDSFHTYYRGSPGHVVHPRLVVPREVYEPTGKEVWGGKEIGVSPFTREDARHIDGLGRDEILAREDVFLTVDFHASGKMLRDDEDQHFNVMPRYQLMVGDVSPGLIAGTIDEQILEIEKIENAPIEGGFVLEF